MRKTNVFLLLVLLFSCMFNEKAKGESIHSDANVIEQQQKKQITGTVLEDTGIPVIGANVLEVGTSNGTVTDIDGNFTLVVESSATIVVSYIGFLDQSIDISGNDNFTITLSEDTQLLDEVVVVGYGTLEKRQVTSSISSISGDDLTLGTGGSDISSALQGKVSGLVMANAGNANAGTTFQLRGLASINAGQQPLIVIDGFPGGDIRSIDQNDILSIDVLKDASAGAIYGTRAAAGVILITTKNGSNTDGKVRVNYTTELRKHQNYGAPEMLSADEYRQYGIGTDYGESVNWWDELINDNNFSHKHHLSFETGTDRTQLFTSVFYENNEGLVVNDSREDIGGRFNVNFRLFDDWLEVRPNVSYRQANRNNNMPVFQQAMRNNPTRSPYDPESETGYNVWLSETLDYNTLADSKLRDYQGLDKWFKPEVSLKLNIKSVPGLSYQQVVGYENRQWELQHYNSKHRRSELENNRKGTAYLGFSKTENFTAEGYGTYIRDFNGGHTLNAVAGYSYFERNGQNFNMSNSDFSVDQIKYWNIGEGSYRAEGLANLSSGKNISEKLMALFARANYSYQDKYLFQASIRHEGSSKFARENRWGNFWSLSGGWRISEEAFMRDISWITDLKVRVGYGVTGNNDFNSSYMANMLGSDTYWMLPSGDWAYSYGKTNNINPHLGWEETHDWNLGIDYSFFDNRLYGKFDYFVRGIDDMLYNVRVPQPPYTQGHQWQNIGSMETRGWEFEVGGDIIRSNELVWNSNLLVSRSWGEIKELYGQNTYHNGNGFPAPGSPGDASRIEAGAKIGTFYIWKHAGFDDDGNFLLYDRNGEVIPADQKTENDKYYVGNYNPLVLAWNNTLSYKNFDLGFNFRSWLDFDIYNSLNMYFGLQNKEGTNVLKDAYGKNVHITGEKQLSDFFLEDGSFLKLDAVTLGYTLPMQQYTRHINNIRIYGTVRNVFTITGYSGMNPEINVTGWDNGVERWWSKDDYHFYPLARTFTLGFQFNF